MLFYFVCFDSFISYHLHETESIYSNHSRFFQNGFCVVMKRLKNNEMIKMNKHSNKLILIKKKNQNETLKFVEYICLRVIISSWNYS